MTVGGPGEPEGLVASIDESGAEDKNGIFYVVTAAILLAGPTASKVALTKVIDVPGRTRPFHWHTEGTTARHAMIECLGAIGAVAHAHVTHPVGRKKQEDARVLGLRKVADCCVDDGVVEVVIESRTAKQDWRDQQSLAAHIDMGLAVRWQPKAEPLLWAADAVAGAVREHLLGDDTYLGRLRDTGVLHQLYYDKLES